MGEGLRLVEKPGATAILINSGRALLLKRIWLPFIVNPGVWFFVGGAQERDEPLAETAYREVLEEVGIGKADLKLLKEADIMLVERRKGVKWKNRLFLMRSSKAEVRLNLENSDHKWAGLDEIRNQKDLLGTLEDPEAVLRLLKPELGRA